MAPHATEVSVSTESHTQNMHCPELIRQPLKYQGTLDQYRSFELTPTIGTEFPDVQLADLLQSDEKLRDLAILASRRGVVFFRSQKIVTDQMKILASKLGELTGKPSTSKLHRHALALSQRDLSMRINGKFDEEVWLISSEIRRNHYPGKFETLRDFASDEWHTDLAYENLSADYGILQISKTPDGNNGGDTVFASAYEAYDRLSPPFQKMLETMKVVKVQNRMAKVVDNHSIDIILENRGAPENKGSDFKSTHPVIRTNPVTGWKSLAATGIAAREGWFEGVTKYESEMLKQYFHTLVVQNHDLQVRFKWGQGDIAIWDNRCTYHCGTDDFEGVREGFRILSVGEFPYFDPASTSRREALRESS